MNFEKWNVASAQAASVGLENVFLSDAVESLLKEIASHFPHGWTLHSDLNDLPPVWGSKNLMKECLKNLVEVSIDSIRNVELENRLDSRCRPSIQLVGQVNGATTTVKVLENWVEKPHSRSDQAPSLPTPLERQKWNECRDLMMQMNGFFEVQRTISDGDARGYYAQLYFLNDPKHN